MPDLGEAGVYAERGVLVMVANLLLAFSFAIAFNCGNAAGKSLKWRFLAWCIAAATLASILDEFALHAARLAGR